MALVWITGASRGLGRALALEMARGGHNLILSARDTQALERVAQTCRALSQNSCALLPFDASDAASIGAALSSVPTIPDIMIHNAGVSQRSSTRDASYALFERVLQTNFLSVVQITQALLDRDPQFMHIVFVSSIAGVHGIPLRSAYSASKSALHRYYETLQAESQQSKLCCTLVVPGAIQTEISQNALQGDLSRYGILDPGQKKGLDVGVAAKRIWRSIERKKRRSFVGMSVRHWLLYVLHRAAPGLLSGMLARAYRKNKLL